MAESITLQAVTESNARLSEILAVMEASRTVPAATGEDVATGEVTPNAESSITSSVQSPRDPWDLLAGDSPPPWDDDFATGVAPILPPQVDPAFIEDTVPASSGGLAIIATGVPATGVELAIVPTSGSASRGGPTSCVVEVPSSEEPKSRRRRRRRRRRLTKIDAKVDKKALFFDYDVFCRRKKRHPSLHFQNWLAGEQEAYVELYGDGWSAFACR